MADAEENEFLQDLCRKELGLDLPKLRDLLHSQAKEQQSLLLRFCADLHTAPDADRRLDVAKRFIMGLATMSDLAADRAMRLLVKMQANCLANVQTQNRMLAQDISRFENEVEELKSILNRVELERHCGNAAADRRFEEEKGILEQKMRDELHACQICLDNPRNVVILPCSHAQFCGECIEAIQRTNSSCPTCRGVIEDTVSYRA